MKSKRLAEAIQQGRRNSVSTANQVLAYLSDALNHRQNLFVKILRKNRNEVYFKTYNVYIEEDTRNICDPRNDRMTIFGRQSCLEEAAAQELKYDLERAIQHDASWGNLPFMVKIDGDTPCACDIIWEDTTDTIYFICDIQQSGVDWNAVTQMIQNLQEFVHELNNANSLTTDSIINAISHVTEDDIQELPNIKQFLLQFIPEQQQQAVRNRYHIGTAANNGQAQPEQTRQNQDALDDEDAQDDEQDINQDDEVAQDADDDQENEEPQQQQQQQQPTVRYLGEWNAAEHGQPGENFTVIFGPYNETDFQNIFNRYPQHAREALVAGMPYRYKQLANSNYNGVTVFGNAQGAKKAFTDVCRNYRFFAFPETTDIRWTQFNKGHECFFQWADGNTPSDMWSIMSGAGNGNEFIGFFYGRCRSEYRRAAANNGNINIHPIWDASNSAVKMQTVQARSKQPNGAGTAQNTQTQPNQSGPMTDEQKRQYIVATIERRLIDELAQPPAGHGTPNDYVIVPIRKQSDNTILVGSVGHRNGSSYYRKTFFNAKSCRTLAQSYDDWQWAGRDRNAAARAFYQKLQRLLDPATAEPPPEKEVINLSPEEQKKLDTAMAAANERLNGTGIEVQITVPGHKPQYNYIQSLGSRQGSGWPKDQHRYFTVMFTGLELQKYFGNQAEAYLRGLGLYRYVEAALAEAKKTYNDIILAVALDNGIPSKS